MTMPLLELHKKKLALAKEICRLTEASVFSDNPKTIDDETERFISLYDERDALIAELMDVHEAIRNSGPDDGDPTDEINAINVQSEAVLERIIELDKRNQNAGKAMLDNVRNSIKRINQGRNVSLKYSNELQDTDGYRLDERN